MPSPLLHLAQVSHAYGPHPVLLDITLSLEAQSLTAILGSSGVGKSTLLRAIAGFITPDRGTITLGGAPMVVDGREVTPAEKRGVGMVFQDHALFPHMSARENIAFGLYGKPEAEIEARADEMLALVGLSERGDALPQALSGGQRQRVALARALAPRPTLLLLDEPFASLDTELRRGLADELRRILQKESVAALLVTHDHRAALSWCDRVAIIGPREEGGPGCLHQHDAPERVYHQPASELAARLTGEVLVLDAEAKGALAQSAIGELSLARPAEGAVTLMVRPETLRFRPQEGGSVQVRARHFEGAVVRVLLDTPIGEIGLPCAEAEPPQVGATGVLMTTREACVLSPSAHA